MMVSNNNTNGNNELVIPNLRVATLNIWGIRFISKDVQVRINHLIDALNRSDFDLVALQEVWSYSDYTKIKNEIRHTYPYAHYFQSGLVGSGCCLFSKHQIQNVFYHKFSLNGYPHKIQHSDWFAGKLVGLAVIKYYRIKLNVYVTHLHANYSIDSLIHNNVRSFLDEYLSHRLSQLFEMAQFITQTSADSAMTLLLGDLNTCDYELGYRLLRQHTELLDAFREKEVSGVSNINQDGSTCYTKASVYGQPPAIKSSFPNGIRIDYILYKTRKEIDVKCLSCKNCFGRIESSNLSYSDHEGVCAEFELKSASATGPKTAVKHVIEPRIDHYLDAKTAVLKQIDNISHSQFFFVFTGVLALIVLLVLNNLNPYFSLVKNFLLTIFVFYCFIYVVFIKMIEKKQLKMTVDALDVVIDGYFFSTASQFKNASLN